MCIPHFVGAERNAHGMPSRFEAGKRLVHLFHRITRGAVAQTEVARGGHPPFLVGHNDRDGVVVVDHTQHEVQISGFIGRSKRAHGLSPHAHLGLLFVLQVGDQTVRDPQRGHHNEHGAGHQNAFHTAHTVVTVHAFS